MKVYAYSVSEKMSCLDRKEADKKRNSVKHFIIFFFQEKQDLKIILFWVFLSG